MKRLAAGVGALYIVIVLCDVAIAATITFVAWHFIAKYW